MNHERFDSITARYARLRLALVGDFCLDRYLEIDPGRAETSIETGLDVYNVVNVRSQPGAAGTILNNLVALGIGEIWPVGFCGCDGEGFELQQALGAKKGVRLDHFLQTPERRTFTYCKPLLVHPGAPPRELNRLDSKNWTVTPDSVQRRINASVAELGSQVDGIIIMDQVDLAETGVVTWQVLESIRNLTAAHPGLLIIADSRRSLRGYPPVCLKMNAAELAVLTGTHPGQNIEAMQQAAATLAASHSRPVFVTMAERGVVGASPGGEVRHVPALPVHGEIDVVGAGDAVSANLAAALASGAALTEAMELAMVAASIVLHQVGTTGTATLHDLKVALASSSL